VCAPKDFGVLQGLCLCSSCPACLSGTGQRSSGLIMSTTKLWCTCQAVRIAHSHTSPTTTLLKTLESLAVGSRVRAGGVHYGGGSNPDVLYTHAVHLHRHTPACTMVAAATLMFCTHMLHRHRHTPACTMVAAATLMLYTYAVHRHRHTPACTTTCSLSLRRRSAPPCCWCTRTRAAPPR